jgi:hypothetical protein
MIEILLLAVVLVFGTVIGWLARDFLEARRRRREFKAWLKSRSFFYPSSLSNNNKN